MLHWIFPLTSEDLLLCIFHLIFKIGFVFFVMWSKILHAQIESMDLEHGGSIVEPRWVFCAFICNVKRKKVRCHGWMVTRLKIKSPSIFWWFLNTANKYIPLVCMWLVSLNYLTRWTYVATLTHMYVVITSLNYSLHIPFLVTRSKGHQMVSHDACRPWDQI